MRMVALPLGKSKKWGEKEPGASVIKYHHKEHKCRPSVVLFPAFLHRKTCLSVFLFRDNVSSTWQKAKISCPLEASVPAINNPRQLKLEIMARTCQILEDWKEKRAVSVLRLLEGQFWKQNSFTVTLRSNYKNRVTCFPFLTLRQLQSLGCSSCTPAPEHRPRAIETPQADILI